MIMLNTDWRHYLGIICQAKMIFYCSVITFYHKNLKHISFAQMLIVWINTRESCDRLLKNILE